MTPKGPLERQGELQRPEKNLPHLWRPQELLPKYMLLAIAFREFNVEKDEQILMIWW